MNSEYVDRKANTNARHHAGNDSYVTLQKFQISSVASWTRDVMTIWITELAWPGWSGETIHQCLAIQKFHWNWRVDFIQETSDLQWYMDPKLGHSWAREEVHSHETREEAHSHGDEDAANERGSNTIESHPRITAGEKGSSGDRTRRKNNMV